MPHVTITLSDIYTECRVCIVVLNVIMLSVIMLNVIMQNVIMLNVIMLNVIMLNVIMMNVIMLSVIMLSVIILSVIMLSAIMLNVIQGSVKANGREPESNLAGFSTLSLAVFVMNAIAWHRQARPHAQLKTRAGYVLLA